MCFKAGSLNYVGLASKRLAGHRATQAEEGPHELPGSQIAHRQVPGNVHGCFQRSQRWHPNDAGQKRSGPLSLYLLRKNLLSIVAESGPVWRIHKPESAVAGYLQLITSPFIRQES